MCAPSAFADRTPQPQPGVPRSAPRTPHGDTRRSDVQGLGVQSLGSGVQGFRGLRFRA